MRPIPLNPFQYGSQNYRILEHLIEHGSITNIEIVKDMNILNSTGRISDVREKIKYAFKVLCKPEGGGVFRYTLKYDPPPLPPLHVEMPEGRHRDSKQGELFG